MRRASIVAILAMVITGCGGSHPSAASVPRGPIATAGCIRQGALSPVPLPQETGVYRGGPLVLVAGEDLAQLPASQLAQPAGTEAIAVLTGKRSAVLWVDPASRSRFSLQFAPSAAGFQSSLVSSGRRAVRFPACGQRVQRFMGGILFTGEGCARLHVMSPGGPSIPLLIPIGNTLRGCPRVSRTPGRIASALPLAFIGVSCPRPNSIACDRVGVGVNLKTPAALITVQISGRLVTLSPPPDPRDDLWLGYLYNAGLRRGPLDVHIPPRHSLWFGEPPVDPEVRVTAFFTNGAVSTTTGYDYLHAGFG
jgi:hypothetical protein